MGRLLIAIVFVATSLVCGLVGHRIGHAQATTSPPEVKRLVTQSMGAVPDAQVRIEEVTFPPGASVPAHRHPGHVFVYVIEGAVESQLESGDPGTYRSGEAFYEPTHGLHTAMENPSDTQIAKVLVMMVTKADQPSLIPEH